MAERYGLRRRCITSVNPSSKYTEFLQLDNDESYRNVVVQRKSDGALFLKKTWVGDGIGDPGQELQIVRILYHPNLVRFEEGYHLRDPEFGALYTPLYKYGTLRHIRYRFLLEKRHPPESFVWHILEEITAALVYIHYGWSTIDSMLSNRSAPHHNHRALTHCKVLLDNMYVGTESDLQFADVTDEESRVNPRIRLGNFDEAEHFPRWNQMRPSLTDAHSSPTARAKYQKDYDLWTEKEIYDIRTFLRSMTWFCGGRPEEETLTEENLWGTSIELPAGYSSQLRELFEAVLPDHPAGNRSISNVGDLAEAIRAFRSELNLAPEPIPIEILGPIHHLLALKRGGQATDLVFQTYIVDDRFVGDDGKPQTPLVYDALIHQDLDHVDAEGEPLPFLYPAPDQAWYDSLERHSPAEIQARVKDTDLDEACPICATPWFEEEMDIVTVPCKGKHIFCVACIKAWFDVGIDCPSCRQVLRVAQGYIVLPADVEEYQGPPEHEPMCGVKEDPLPTNSDSDSDSSGGKKKEPQEPEEDEGGVGPSVAIPPGVYPLHVEQFLGIEPRV